MSVQQRFMDQRIAKSRAEEAKTDSMRRMLVTHNILAGHAKSENRVEGMRREASQAAERRDLFTDYQFVKQEQEKERRQLIAEAEERLADELARRNAQKTREEMDKKRICDGSEELRALKEKLHAAKVNKERAQQLLEIEVRKEKDRHIDHAIAEYMENERLEHKELEYKLEIEKMKQRERVKTINQQQIAMREAQREEAMQEYMKEKSQVDELVQRIEREDREEAKAKEEKRIESREMLLRFKKEQAERQEQMERDEEMEMQKIADYARDKAEREERLAREKEAAEKEKERMILGIIERAEAKNKEAEEFEFLRNELHQEEHEAEAKRREELQLRKKMEDREEMRRAYVSQMEMQERKKSAALEEEAKIRETLLAKFAEDDRIEQMAEHKRRMKVEAHKREANRLIQLRKEAFESAREAEREEERALRAEEGKRQIVIDAEKRKLLEEFAVPLKDFLPKGTMDNQADYDMVFKTGGYPKGLAVA